MHTLVSTKGSVFCARAVHEWHVFIPLGLASSESRFPELLKTLETKGEEGAIREDSRALQAGGQRFEPAHLHQHIDNRIGLSRSPECRKKQIWILFLIRRFDMLT